MIKGCVLYIYCVIKRIVSFLPLIHYLFFSLGEDNWFICYTVDIINFIWFTAICFVHSAILYSNLDKTSYRSHQLFWVPLLIGQFELKLRLSRNQWDANWPWWSSYHQSSRISMPRAFTLTNKPGLLEFQKLLYFFIWILLGYVSFLAFFHSEQLVWSGYVSDSNNMNLFLFLVMSSGVQRIILLPCISLFLCQLLMK